MGSTRETRLDDGMHPITRMQREAFADNILLRVCRKLAKRLLVRHPAAPLGQNAERIAEALKPDVLFAHQHGFRSTRLLERYTDISATVGLGFGEREDWAYEILSRRDLSPMSKLDRLEETSVFVVLGGRS